MPRSRFDFSRWQRASHDLASMATKKEPREILVSHMKALLKSILGITPPAQMSGGAFSSRMPDNADKQRGESAILSDLHRIFRPVRGDQLAQIRDFQGNRAEMQYGHKGQKPLGIIVEQILSLSEMKQWHQDRRRADGRVVHVNRDVTVGHKKRDLRGLDTGIVTQADFDTYFKSVVQLVGMLAAGWNSASELLKLRMPPWIKRHGNKHGNAQLIVGKDFVRVTIINDVPFTDNVRGLDRRIQAALNFSAGALERQYEHALRRMARAAFR